MSPAEAATLGRLLRDVCALMLAEGKPAPALAAWCERMLSDPDAAERAVGAVDRAVDAREPR